MNQLSHIDLSNAAQARAVVLEDTKALAVAMIAAKEGIDAAKAVSAEARGNRMSVSAMLATTALRAVLAGCEDAVKETYADTDAWKRIKGAWSMGSKLARELRAGNTFVVPKNEGEDAEENAFMVGGRMYCEGEKLAAEILSPLANPSADETSILVLAQARSKHAKLQRTRAEEAHNADLEIWGAFLKSDAGKAYEGESADTVRNAIFAEHEGDTVAASRAIGEAFQAGAEHLAVFHAEQAALKAKAERASLITNALGVISREINGEIVTALEGMIAEYRTRDIPEQTQTQASAVRVAA